jgi:hypothetical protein
MIAFPDLSNCRLQQLLEFFFEGPDYPPPGRNIRVAGLSAPWPDNPAWNALLYVFSIAALNLMFW